MSTSHTPREAPGTPALQARDPHFASRCRESFRRQGAMALLGARLTEIAPGRCTIEVPYREALSQQHGYFHGGILSTVADSAAGYAAFSLVDAETSVLTVEFKVNFLAPARGELLIARGEVLRAGRTLTVARTEVSVLSEGRCIPCASMVETVMNLHGREERPVEEDTAT